MMDRADVATDVREQRRTKRLSDARRPARRGPRRREGDRHRLAAAADEIRWLIAAYEAENDHRRDRD